MQTKRIEKHSNKKTILFGIGILAFAAFLNPISSFSDESAASEETISSDSEKKADAAATGAIETKREITKKLAIYYIDDEKYEEAEKYLAEHLKEDPTDAGGWRLLGMVSSRKADWGKAEEAYDKASELSNGMERGNNLYLLADAQTRAGHQEKAHQTLANLKDQPGF